MVLMCFVLSGASSPNDATAQCYQQIGQVTVRPCVQMNAVLDTTYTCGNGSGSCDGDYRRTRCNRGSKVNGSDTFTTVTRPRLVALPVGVPGIEPDPASEETFECSREYRCFCEWRQNHAGISADWCTTIFPPSKTNTVTYLTGTRICNAGLGGPIGPGGGGPGGGDDDGPSGNGEPDGGSGPDSGDPTNPDQ